MFRKEDGREFESFEGYVRSPTPGSDGGEFLRMGKGVFHVRQWGTEYFTLPDHRVSVSLRVRLEGR